MTTFSTLPTSPPTTSLRYFLGENIFRFVFAVDALSECYFRVTELISYKNITEQLSFLFIEMLEKSKEKSTKQKGKRRGRTFSTIFINLQHLVTH
ncbi:CLUMA_CG020324, isoform A [Clunio marinus]|uniref:CLUMA_CG020324, isoform A n=1 Tax=Clunio marinus TaxID=568069 RepID=A0A1J1J4L5_9DIPT|nr:CLUMA_CG020324, isoform A [Clunio marinus]